MVSVEVHCVSDILRSPIANGSSQPPPIRPILFSLLTNQRNMEEAADKSNVPDQNAVPSLGSGNEDDIPSLGNVNPPAIPSLGNGDHSTIPSLGNGTLSGSQPPVLDPSSSLPGTMTPAIPSLGNGQNPQLLLFPQRDVEPEEGSDGEALAKFSSRTTSLPPRRDLEIQSATSPRVFLDGKTSPNVHDPPLNDKDRSRDDDETSVEASSHDFVTTNREKKASPQVPAIGSSKNILQNPIPHSRQERAARSAQRRTQPPYQCQ